MIQGSSKTMMALRKSVSIIRCLHVTGGNINVRTLATSTIGNNSVIPTLPELHYTDPEPITIDAAAKALYDKLPRGEFWDRQPEELRLYYGTDEESMYKYGKHRSNALELVHRVPVVEVEGDMAICDGGGGGLGHPLEYISLEVPDSINYCKYCSLRYTMKKGSKPSAH